MKGVFNPIIDVDKGIIYKRMRVTGKSRIQESIDKVYDKCFELAISKIQFQTIFLKKDNTFKISIDEVDNCEKIIFCFASVGSEISDLINEYFSNAEYIEGYVLNEISNEIIMEATNQMYRYLKDEMKKEGYNLTKRYSPGECEIELNYQKLIIEELKKEFEVDASLTESFMINPEKSTLFLYGADKNIPELKVDFDCSTCTSIDCPYKMN